MGLIGPIRGGGSLPLGPCAKGGPLPHWPAHLPPSGISPTSGRDGGSIPSLAYLRRGRGALFGHSIEFFLSLFLLPSADSPCLDSAPCWGFLHHMHAVVLLESGYESIFFLLL